MPFYIIWTFWFTYFVFSGLHFFIVKDLLFPVALLIKSFINEMPNPYKDPASSDAIFAVDLIRYHPHPSVAT